MVACAGSPRTPRPVKNTSDVIVIGAGVIGLMTARELVAAGLTVTLLERAVAGLEASHAAGGILAPLPPWEAAEPVRCLWTRSREAYPELAEELREITGIDCEWIRSGMLVTGGPDRETALEWAEKHAVEAAALDEDGAREFEPGLAPGCGAAIWLPEVAQIRNTALLEALVTTLQRSGVLILENTPATSLRIEHGRVSGVETSAGKLDSGLVVLAAGAWSGELMTASDHPIDVEPVTGQMISFRHRPGLVSHIVLRGAHYVIPRQDGVYVVGSTLESVGFNKELTRTALRQLRRAASNMIPALAGRKPHHHWCGLHAGSDRPAPLIGRHPRVDGLLMSTGHFRNGLALAPASARLIADLILERTPAVDPDSYVLE